jgi:lysozyme family protein
MADFLPAVQYVLVNEGSTYTDNPDDLGGPTKWGITLTALSAWRGSTCTAEDVENLTQQEAQQIYQTNYWDVMKLGTIGDQNCATAIFDQSVNQGIRGVAILVQKTLVSLGHPVQIDGDIGPSTLLTLNTSNARSFLATFIVAVQNSYVTHVITDPTQITFLYGWLSRSQRMIQLLV